MYRHKLHHTDSWLDLEYIRIKNIFYRSLVEHQDMNSTAWLTGSRANVQNL